MSTERSDTHVVAIVGSPRHGNSSFLVDVALKGLGRQGFRCEKIVLAKHDVRPCKGHDKCGEFAACLQHDDAPAILEKVFAADCLLLASPVYFENVSAQMKTLMDRSLWYYEHGIHPRARAAGLIAVAENSGLCDALDAMRRYLDLLGGVPCFEAAGYADHIHDASRNEQLIAAVEVLVEQLGDALRSSQAVDRD